MAEVKPCPFCKISKPLDEFYKSRPGCKPCERAKQKLRLDMDRASHNARRRQRYATDPKARQSHKNSELKRLYGSSYTEKIDLLLEQDFLCAGCTEPLDFNRHTHLDHCHESGKIRGILCNHCNLILGHCQDSSSRLKQLIVYLRKSEGLM